MKSDSIMAFVLGSALAAVASAQTDETVQSLALNNMYIGNWVQPNAFMGIAIMLLFLSFFYLGIVMLAQIQTPLFIREKTLNWGIVEEAE